MPWRQRRQLARRIGIVFGQRSQLWYTLPVRSSFELLRRIYDIERPAHQARLARLTATFDIGALLDRPVSELSLGQRIRCEIAAALLHGPGVLLLDEPTIGLDVTAKAALRDHLGELSRAEGTTVLLTSHDTGDIETICDRVIVIDRGRLLLDAPLESLRRDFLQRRSMILVTAEEHPHFAMPGVAVAAEPYRLTLSLDTVAGAGGEGRGRGADAALAARHRHRESAAGGCHQGDLPPGRRAGEGGSCHGLIPLRPAPSPR